VICYAPDWGETSTFGNVIVTQNTALSGSTIRHEINHSWQYAALGPELFLAAWARGEIDSAIISTLGFQWAEAICTGSYPHRGCFNNNRIHRRYL